MVQTIKYLVRLGVFRIGLLCHGNKIKDVWSHVTPGKRPNLCKGGILCRLFPTHSTYFSSDKDKDEYFFPLLKSFPTLERRELFRLAADCLASALLGLVFLALE
jgi:hypothetical protein